MAHLGLDAIEFGVKLLKVRESPQVHVLHVVADVLIAEEVLDDLVAQIDFLK